MKYKTAVNIYFVTIVAVVAVVAQRHAGVKTTQHLFNRRIAYFYIVYLQRNAHQSGRNLDAK
jgi:uncharacterized membrane protein